MKDVDVQRIIEEIQRSLVEASEKKIQEPEEEKIEIPLGAPENKK
jgi:hypothetical protein